VSNYPRKLDAPLPICAVLGPSKRARDDVAKKAAIAANPATAERWVPVEGRPRGHYRDANSHPDINMQRRKYVPPLY
jgi:hypothetical protein